MQYINLNKTINFEKEIEDLLLISIDDQIEIIEDKEGIRISGKINIGGDAKTSNENKNFSDFIDLDIYLTYEEIEERNSLNVSVNDFNYKIKNNQLLLDISLKIDGLKEIETTFLSEENNESIFEEKIKDEESKVYIDVDIEIENERDSKV